MVQLDKDLFTWLKSKFYTETEVDTLLNNKSDLDHTHPIDNTLNTTSSNPVENNVINNALNNKADIKHDSTNTEYGAASTTKYGHVKFDTKITTGGTNPVTSGVIQNALNNKSDNTHTHKNLEKTEITAGNLDTITNTGWYSYRKSVANDENILNVPEKDVAAILEVFDDFGDGAYIIQKAYTLPSNRKPITYCRIKYGTYGWGVWHTVYTDQNLTNATSSKEGLFSSDDKYKLDNIAVEANKTIVDSTISSTSPNPVRNSTIKTELDKKAPINHSSVGTEYGAATTSNYGHVKIINNLNSNSYVNGLALAAYQGKLLKDLIDTKSPQTHEHTSEEIKLTSTGNTSVYDELMNHDHGDIKHDGVIGTKANLPLITTTNGKITTGEFGTGQYQFCSGNDSRLYDTRTPKKHNSSDTSYGASDNGIYGHSKATATSPKALAKTASVGSETSSFARGDHVHPLPANATRNADGLMSADDKSKLDYFGYRELHTLALVNTTAMSGTVKLILKNGWATIYYEELNCTNTTGNDYTPFCTLPKSSLAKIYANMNMNNLSDNAIILRVNGKYLEGRVIDTNARMYGHITFPYEE